MLLTLIQRYLVCSRRELERCIMRESFLLLTLILYLSLAFQANTSNLYLIASAPILVKSHKQRILSTHSKHIFFSQTEAKEKPAWVKRVFLRLALVFRYLPEGAAVTSFTALVTGCKFSRAQQRLHVFPRLHRLHVLPPLTPGLCFCYGF